MKYALLKSKILTFFLAEHRTRVFFSKTNARILSLHAFQIEYLNSEALALDQAHFVSYALVFEGITSFSLLKSKNLISLIFDFNSLHDHPKGYNLVLLLFLLRKNNNKHEFKALSNCLVLYSTKI